MLRAAKLMTVALMGLTVVLTACLSGSTDLPPQLDSVDIYLLELDPATGRPTGTPPVNLTDRDGYDNQPMFLSDGSAILYASAREDQVDIWRHDLATGEAIQLTRTPEREYSPTPTPGQDGFSTVRVESDGSQRLWRFDSTGGSPMLLLDWETEVGYHSWIDEKTVALMVVDEPTELRFADVTVGWAERRAWAYDVGRCLRTVPGRNALSFIQTDTPTESWVIEMDLLTRETRPLVRAIPGSEDFIWLKDGTLMMASGSRLFAWRQDGNGEWEERADFSSSGLNGITRLAINQAGDRLALVAERPPVD